LFKTFDLERDIKTQVSSINEVLVFNGVVFTGTLSGTSVYAPNVKKFVHWTSGTNSGSFYVSMYSGHHTASTSVELLNITFGQSISSSYYGSALAVNKTEKNKMYRLHAKMLLGDEDMRFNISGSDRDDLFFVHVKRSQMKDEIKKGSVSIDSMFSGSHTGSIALGNYFLSVATTASVSDSGAQDRYESTSRGDVGNLITGSKIAGLVYYQAGVIVLIPEIFSNTSSCATNIGNHWYLSGSRTMDFGALMVTGAYGEILDAGRSRFRSLTLINQTNLQSTYYFCRALNDEYNYSSNPTFIDSSNRIVPTSGSNNLQTRTYPTKIALLGEDQEVLAVASLGEPIKKSPESEVLVKVRLDN
jgi:hypothetical protein